MLYIDRLQYFQDLDTKLRNTVNSYAEAQLKKESEEPIWVNRSE